MNKAISLSDKPTPPINLAVGDITAESADLTWEEPEDNGGSPITGYLVEKKDIKRRSWQEATKTTDFKTTVTKLQEGNQYLFRVSAENQYGISDPVELAEPITAKNPFSKCDTVLYVSKEIYL